MNKLFLTVLSLSLLGLASGRPKADHGYGAPSYHAPSSSYGAPPSSGYGAPKPTYHAPNKNEVVNIHHHYHHAAPAPAYKPSYKPSYKPTYHPPAPSYHAPPTYHTRDSYHSDYHGDDEYIHLHKEELTRSALLLGAGILKGVLITGLINNANNGITIGKK